MAGDIKIEGIRVAEYRRSEVRPDHPGEHHFFQVSSLQALQERHYDGDMTVAELVGHGNQGIGTFDALDGEMVMLDGTVYRITVDGTTHAVSPEIKTPFALTTFFEPDVEFHLSGPIGRHDLEAEMDARADASRPCRAVRIQARLDSMKARSAVAEQQPYRPFAEAVADNQRIFTFNDAEGTMVGFRFPEEAASVGLPGYHLHFVTGDRKRGGHMLDYVARDVRVGIQHATVLQVELPPGVPAGVAVTSEAEQEAIRRVEG